MLFVGSDEHALARCHRPALIASARLHRLVPRRTASTCSACCSTGRESASSNCVRAIGKPLARLDVIEIERELSVITVALRRAEQPATRWSERDRHAHRRQQISRLGRRGSCNGYARPGSSAVQLLVNDLHRHASAANPAGQRHRGHAEPGRCVAEVAGGPEGDET